MEFSKMHGLGNDFILIEAQAWEEADRFQPFAAALCDRNFGIGADGLVISGRDSECDIFMRIFNPDGSEPEMCGNAIRCVAKNAWEKKLVTDTQISVRTLAGPRHPEIIINNGLVESIRVDMGEPVLETEKIPVETADNNNTAALSAAGQDFEFTAVSMGNPHCVIFVDKVEQIPVEEWGAEIEKHRIFPAKTNVEFVEVLGKNELIMRVWERGAGVTLACGTGACASLVASVLNNKSERQSVIHLLGGDLFVEWDSDTNHVFMTGPAATVFTGKIDIQY
jgi:diaminopimelate epimerase